MQPLHARAVLGNGQRKCQSTSTSAQCDLMMDAAMPSGRNPGATNSIGCAYAADSAVEQHGVQQNDAPSRQRAACRCVPGPSGCGGLLPRIINAGEGKPKHKQRAAAAATTKTHNLKCHLRLRNIVVLAMAPTTSAPRTSESLDKPSCCGGSPEGSEAC